MHKGAEMTSIETKTETKTEAKRRAREIVRPLISTLSAAAVVCAVAAPVAAAKTVTVHKSFKLQPNTTASYELPRNAHLSLADAGYVLTGPSLSAREDDLVDPYPHQPRDVGQISRDGVTVLDAGIGRVGATPPLIVRVKTGKLSGAFTLTLYIEQQGAAGAASAQPLTTSYSVGVNPTALASGKTVKAKLTVTSPEASVKSWWAPKTVAAVVRKGVNGGRQTPYSSEGYRCTPVVRGETTSFTCKLRGADVPTVVRLTFAVVYRGDQASG
jgi:hypothetical protein